MFYKYRCILLPCLLLLYLLLHFIHCIVNSDKSTDTRQLMRCAIWNVSELEISRIKLYWVNLNQHLTTKHNPPARFPFHLPIDDLAVQPNSTVFKMKNNFKKSVLKALKRTLWRHLTAGTQTLITNVFSWLQICSHGKAEVSGSVSKPRFLNQ